MFIFCSPGRARGAICGTPACYQSSKWQIRVKIGVGLVFLARRLVTFLFILTRCGCENVIWLSENIKLV